MNEITRVSANPSMEFLYAGDAVLVVHSCTIFGPVNGPVHESGDPCVMKMRFSIVLAWIHRVRSFDLHHQNPIHDARILEVKTILGNAGGLMIL